MSEVDAGTEAAAKALMPWWRKPLPVAAITAILAAVVPATTAVSGVFQRSREMALQTLKQAHDASMEELKLRHTIQMDYLQHMGTEEDKVRLLRIVIGTSGDKALVSWAKSEKEEIDKTIAKAEKRAVEAENQAKLAAESLAAAEHDLAAKSQETEQERKGRRELQAVVSAKVSELASKRAELAAKMAELEKLRPTPRRRVLFYPATCQVAYSKCLSDLQNGAAAKALCEIERDICSQVQSESAP